MRGDRGQTTTEWLGIAAIVVAILVAIPVTGAGGQVQQSLSRLVCQVTGGGCVGAAGPEGTPGAGGDDGADPGSDPAGSSGQGGAAGAAGAGDGGRGDDELPPEELVAIADALASGDPAAIRHALEGLSAEEVDQATARLTDELALTDGVPQPIRVQANRQRISDHIAELEELLATLDPDDDGGILGDISDLIDEHNPIPDFVFGPPGTDTPAEQAALIRSRIDTLQGWIDDDRQIIRFEPPSDPRGTDAIVVEVFGDLETADNIGVIIPGITNDIDGYDPGLATHARDIADASGGPTAVVAHLGHDTPDSLTDPATRTGARAREAAPDLAGFIDALDADGRDRNVTLVGHSYGTRVAAEAARQAGDIDSLVILGSPGTGAETAGDLGLDPADVYIARNGDDPIAHVGTIEGIVTDIGIDPGDLGHGRDPVDDGYGGQLISAPDTGGHSAYWDPTQGVGISVVAIVDGRPEDAIIERDRGPGAPR